MTSHSMAIETYFEGFNRNDRQCILGCLAADVVWEIDGLVRLAGKTAVSREIERTAFGGRPRLIVHRLVEEADVVVAKGIGEMPERGGATSRFAFYDVFSFAGGAIRRVESSRMPLPRGTGAAKVGRAA